MNGTSAQTAPLDARPRVQCCATNSGKGVVNGARTAVQSERRPRFSGVGANGPTLREVLQTSALPLGDGAPGSRTAGGLRSPPPALQGARAPLPPGGALAENPLPAR